MYRGFKDKDDSDYLARLAHIQAGKEYLEKDVTRFDMKNLRSRWEYYREMKHYGILPEAFDPKSYNADLYELDRKYLRSLWCFQQDEEE